MEKDRIICPECATENEPQYLYCKNCGTPLTAKEPAGESPKSDFNGTADSAGNASAGSFPCLDYFDGIPQNEMAGFIGKKSAVILQKFTYMEISRKKTSWCWPVAILSFLFGPLGAALWFFYRKMYKIAVILTAVGILTAAVTVALNPKPLSEKELQQITEQYTAAVEQENLTEAFHLLSELFGSGRALSSAIQNIVNIATLFITSIFAYYWYKNHVISGILKYRSAAIDPRYYTIGLSTVGGVSGGMLAVGILLMIVTNPIAKALVLAIRQLLRIFI